MQDDLTVRRAPEDAALVLQLLAQLGSIGDLAVVGHRQRAAVGQAGYDGLHVFHLAAARSTVAHMADGVLAGHAVQIVAAEHITQQALALPAADGLAVCHGDTRALLAPVLQCMQAEIGQMCRVALAVYAEHTAFLVQTLIQILSHSVTFTPLKQINRPGNDYRAGAFINSYSRTRYASRAAPTETYLILQPTAFSRYST